MGAYPTSPRSDFLAWCQAHSSIFIENAAAIGLSESQAQKFKQAVSEATGSEAAAFEARQASLAASAANSRKFSELRKITGDTVKVIKTFAQTTGNDNVYDIAQVPAPQDPSTLPPPAKPTNLRVALDPTNGAPTITWKASNPRGAAGTSYIIRRRTSPTGAWEFVGVTGSKKFVDNSFFAGPDSVQYTVQGQRSDSSGPLSDILVVNFGRVGGGGGGGFSVSSFSSEQDQQPMSFKKAA